MFGWYTGRGGMEVDWHFLSLSLGFSKIFGVGGISIEGNRVVARLGSGLIEIWLW